MQKLSICLALIIAIFSFPLSQSFADEFLFPILTIPILRDSVKVSSITPIGDFNADGYSDLAIGVGHKTTIPQFEAVYLYYGGNSFDAIPDLTFLPDTNNVFCPPRFSATGYGDEVIALTDFNGDGYNDFAVSAPGLCIETYHEGRIYVYFGGPNSDSIADLLIDGFHAYDGLGMLLASGEINGDTLSDIIAKGGDPFYGEHLNIFSGGNPPNSTCDWVYAFSPPISAYRLKSGFDPNGDGYDDFAATDVGNLFLFLGGDSISHDPVLQSTYQYDFFDFDLSGDRISDFDVFLNSHFYLCLGSNQLDYLPDYTLGVFGYYAFIYHLGLRDSLLVSDDIISHCFGLYNINFPPDSVSYSSICYGYSHFVSNPYIGDINLDGIDELALGSPNDSLNQHVDILTIQETGIIDGSEIQPPGDFSLSAYPNPFNSATTITLTGAGQAEIGIYDITGRLITTLHAVGGQALWDASAYSSGLYFARLTGDKAGTIKLVLVK